MPSFSRDIEETLHRALSLARVRRHQFATLEHLLISLIDDPQAADIMANCGVNLLNLRETVTHFVDTELQNLVLPVDRPALTDDERQQVRELIEQRAEDRGRKPGTPSTAPDLNSFSEPVQIAVAWDEFKSDGPGPTRGFQRVVQRAILHVQSSGREEVTGASLLVALFSERDSYAVYFLQQQDMSRIDAVSYVNHGTIKPSSSEDGPSEVPVSDASSGDTVPRAAGRLPDLFGGNRSVSLDMKPHFDAVSAQPTLSTPRVAEKIVEFISEFAQLYPTASGSMTDSAVTVGVYGPWGSGKSTLLSMISQFFCKDGAIVVSINAWKWDGAKNLHSFMTDQLLESLSGAFRWKARLIRALLFVRRHFRWFVIALSVLSALVILSHFVDFSQLSFDHLLGKGSIFALIGASTVVALAKPIASLVEKLLIRPKTPPEPGVALSQAFRYLMLAKQIGDTAQRPIIFVFDDLDRCDPDRVMKFVGSIQTLTLAGAINIIGCDDRIISSAIYKQYQDIADLSGEGREFGTRFLEKIVQVHFRMPGLCAEDLVSLGIKKAAVTAPEPTTGSNAIPFDIPTNLPSNNGDVVSGFPPVKDLDPEAPMVPDAMHLSFICGEVLGEVLTLYRMPIRKVKFLSNVMKLYTMAFPPADARSAFRIAAFIAMVNVDEAWLREVYAATDELAMDVHPEYATIYEYLGNDKKLIKSLYRLCGIEEKGNRSTEIERI